MSIEGETPTGAVRSSTAAVGDLVLDTDARTVVELAEELVIGLDGSPQSAEEVPYPGRRCHQRAAIRSAMRRSSPICGARTTPGRLAASGARLPRPTADPPAAVKIVSTIDAYLICGTPRTGSTLLSDLLRSTGVAGRPDSYFRLQDQLAWAERWHLPRGEDGALPGRLALNAEWIARYSAMAREVK